jgi:subtilisin family serine protease
VTSVDPETTYYFEIRPWAAVQAQCTLSVAERGAAPETDLPGDPSGPFGVYRPSVIAPGNAVISTQGVSAIKALSAQGNPQAALQRPLYASSSGTSMSCPAVAGISALVMQAWYENNGEEYPSPEQVIRIIEGTAEENAEEVYTPYNVGAGFVNAKKAVETAIAGEVPGYTDIRLPENEKGDAAE